MGRASNWFRSLLSSKKSSESSPAKENKKKKKSAGKWGLSNSVNLKKHVEEDPRSSPYVEGLDANRHAIAVAAATAAVAEAALAAAHAAAQVVRLTSGGVSRRGAPQYGNSDRRRPVSAAVKIQSAFRAYLARRALRALKGLVKLQALVRGHIVRKQSADMLRRMQAMARIQARASTHRSYTSDYSIYPEFKLSNSRHPDIASVRKYEERPNISKHGGRLPQQHNSRSGMSNSVNKETSHLASRWLNHWMEQSTWNNLHDTSVESNHGDDARSDKILEVDTWKPHHHNPVPRNDQNAPPTAQYFSAWNNMEQDHSRAGPLSSRHSYKHQKPNPSISSEDVLSVKSHQQNQIAAAFWTAENSPRVHSASSGPTGELRGPFTPARSECSRSFFGDFIGHPSYMANTESSRAKVRSYSAPKQRMQLESLSSKYGRDFWESETISEKGSVLPTNNQSAYRVKRQGTPTRDAAPGYNSVYGRKL